ncbi:MAG: hopanoid biosynthesis associated radical SAM protein HpnJ [Bacteroidota bacterium]
MMKTLFLNPPSFEGFDGGAGSRFQARREIRSFWYPTWLAQVAALVPQSKLIDAPARGLSLEDIAPLAKDFELAVLYASAPTFASDVAMAEALKRVNPHLRIGFVGALSAVDPERCLSATPVLDFAAGSEFDFTIQEVAEGRPYAQVDGITWRDGERFVHNPPRALIHDMDALPSVAQVYARDLVIEDYFIGYLKHPYMSLYTGRGCRSKCSFCLWPQTIGGRVYRTRSITSVIDEVARMRQMFPQVKEFFFDDDTFTDDRPRVEAIARELGRLGVTWSCTAKPDVPRQTLAVMKANGCRLLLVGYESGVQAILNNIRKGTRVDIMRRFTADCHDLGILIHGTFILGLPGETRQTIKDTIAFAKDINPRTLQVSLAAPYPGTELYAQAQANNWLSAGDLVRNDGRQLAALGYADLPAADIFAAVSDFYRQFYFRPAKIAEICGEMLGDWDMAKRRLREGVEFLSFLNRRRAA